MSLRAGDLAVVVKGLWPNVGRIVYVDRYVENHNFTAMGLGHLPGWRVRSWGRFPLETVGGPKFSGYTPHGSLKPLGPLPTDQARQVEREMAEADFREAMADLAAVLHRQERAHSRRVRTKRKAGEQTVSLTCAAHPQAADEAPRP